MKLVPELYCTDIERTRRFYIDILQMQVKYERPEDGFIYFLREGIGIMIEQLNMPGRRWLTGEMEKPFGRGVNFQWEVSDVQALYENILRQAPDSSFLELETKEYRRNNEVIKQTQFVVQDPDGYLFRFCSD